jgi:hypothetical protein
MWTGVYFRLFCRLQTLPQQIALTLSVDRSYSAKVLNTVRRSFRTFEATNFKSDRTAQCKTHSNQGIVSAEAPHAAALIGAPESSKSSQRLDNGDAKNGQCRGNASAHWPARSLQQVPEGDSSNVLSRDNSSVEKRLGELARFSKRHLHPDTFKLVYKMNENLNSGS